MRKGKERERDTLSFLLNITSKNLSIRDFRGQNGTSATDITGRSVADYGVRYVIVSYEREKAQSKQRGGYLR